MSREKLDRAISNCILEIPLIPMNARFLSQINNFGSPLDDRYHLEILTQAKNPASFPFPEQELVISCLMW